MTAARVPDAGRRSLARNLVRATRRVPPFLFDHIRRRDRIERSTRTVSAFSEPCPPLPQELRDDPIVQHRDRGIGPLVMRTYEVTIAAAALPADELLARLIRSPGDLNDNRIAGFVRDDRPAVDLLVGDEFVVELPGPWNGPVRVLRADDEQLLLITLDGHMEAGQIRFDTLVEERSGPGGRAEPRVTFRIRSWARGGNVSFTLIHLFVRIAKELQTAMWVAMCEGAVRVSGGYRDGTIRVATEVLEKSTPEDDPVGDVVGPGTMEKLGGSG